MKRAGQCGGQVLQDQWQFGWAMHQVQGGECLLFGILLLVTSFTLQIQSLHIQHLPLCKRLVQPLHQNFSSLQCHTSCYVVGFRVDFMFVMLPWLQTSSSCFLALVGLLLLLARDQKATEDWKTSSCHNGICKDCQNLEQIESRWWDWTCQHLLQYELWRFSSQGYIQNSSCRAERLFLPSWSVGESLEVTIWESFWACYLYTHIELCLCHNLGLLQHWEASRLVTTACILQVKKIQTRKT